MASAGSQGPLVRAAAPSQEVPPAPSVFVLSLARRVDRRESIGSTLSSLAAPFSNFTFVDAVDGKLLSERRGSNAILVEGTTSTWRCAWRHVAEDPPWVLLNRRTQRSGGFLCQHLIRVFRKRPIVEIWNILACALGHEEMARRTSLGDAPCSYIFEDDAVLPKGGGGLEHFAHSVTSAMECIRVNAAPSQDRDFNIIYLGGTRGFPMKAETPTVSDAHHRCGLICGVNTYQTHAYIMSKAFAEPFGATLAAGYAADAALAWLSKRVDQSTLWFRFEPPLMQQKNHFGDSDIIDKVVRAAGVGSQPRGGMKAREKGEGKRCQEQDVEGKNRGKDKHPRKTAESHLQHAQIAAPSSRDKSTPLFGQTLTSEQREVDEASSSSSGLGGSMGNGTGSLEGFIGFRKKAESHLQPAQIAAPSSRRLWVKTARSLPAAPSPRRLSKRWRAGVLKPRSKKRSSFAPHEFEGWFWSKGACEKCVKRAADAGF
jgi:hypothetical protein